MALRTEPRELASLPGLTLTVRVADAREAQWAGGGGETEQAGLWQKCYPAHALLTFTRAERKRAWLRSRPLHPSVAFVLLDHRGLYLTCGHCSSFRANIAWDRSETVRLCSRCRRACSWQDWREGELSGYLEQVFEDAWPELGLLTLGLLAQEAGDLIEETGRELDPSAW